MSDRVEHTSRHFLSRRDFLKYSSMAAAMPLVVAAQASEAAATTAASVLSQAQLEKNVAIALRQQAGLTGSVLQPFDPNRLVYGRDLTPAQLEAVQQFNVLPETIQRSAIQGLPEVPDQTGNLYIPGALKGSERENFYFTDAIMAQYARLHTHVGSIVFRKLESGKFRELQGEQELEETDKKILATYLVGLTYLADKFEGFYTNLGEGNQDVGLSKNRVLLMNTRVLAFELGGYGYSGSTNDDQFGVATETRLGLSANAWVIAAEIPHGMTNLQTGLGNTNLSQRARWGLFSRGLIEAASNKLGFAVFTYLFELSKTLPVEERQKLYLPTENEWQIIQNLIYKTNLQFDFAQLKRVTSLSDIYSLTPEQYGALQQLLGLFIPVAGDVNSTYQLVMEQLSLITNANVFVPGSERLDGALQEVAIVMNDLDVTQYDQPALDKRTNPAVQLILKAARAQGIVANLDLEAVFKKGLLAQYIAARPDQQTSKQYFYLDFLTMFAKTPLEKTAMGHIGPDILFVRRPNVIAILVEDSGGVWRYIDMNAVQFSDAGSAAAPMARAFIPRNAPVWRQTADDPATVNCHGRRVWIVTEPTADDPVSGKTVKMHYEYSARFQAD